jgi:hypothetical protein
MTKASESVGNGRSIRVMRFLLALATIIAFAWPACAQQKTPQPAPGGPPKTQKEIEADKAVDRAYQKSLGNIPNQPPADPWGNARSTDTPKTAAKSKPGAKIPAN